MSEPVRHLRPLPPLPETAKVPGERVPSAAAQARLSGALRDRADAYRQGASLDLTILDALMRMDELEAAAKTLEHHRASLQALAADLQGVVADAAVEREAERVYDACIEELHPRPLAPQVGFKRRLLALTGAAAVAIALVLPSVRISPKTALASVENRPSQTIAAARERLDAARSVARARRAQVRPAGFVASPTVADSLVRARVRAMLAADASGGSAAPTSTQPSDVTVLDTVRSLKPKPLTGKRPDVSAAAPVVPLKRPDARPGDNEPASDSDPGQAATDPVDVPADGEAPDPLQPPLP